MEATGTLATPAEQQAPARRPGRVLAFVSDERLVKRVRAGSEEAFAVLYERHQRKLLSFCRHMLGSQHEAEDALQQTFVNAYRDMLRGERDLHVRPWLYRIARNQCISMLRARRPQVELGPDEPSLRGLAEEVAGRSDLRDLLRDIAELPADQRAALVLAELHDNSHTEVAEILDCDREKVKSLVFQARSSLLKSREARQIPCVEVRRQLSVLRGGSLRRSVIRRHLSACEGCRSFRDEVKRQRAAIAVILPVVPSGGLKLGAASAVATAKAGIASLAGSGSGTAAGAGAGVSAGTAASAGAAGPLTAVAAKAGVSGVALKGAVAAVAVTTAVGGAAGVEAVRHQRPHDRPPAAAAAKRTPVPRAAGRTPASALPAGAGDRRRGGRDRSRVRERIRERRRGKPGAAVAYPRRDRGRRSQKQRAVRERRHMERQPREGARTREQRPTAKGPRREPRQRLAERRKRHRASPRRRHVRQVPADTGNGVLAPRPAGAARPPSG